jgi:hypothetical protein
MLNSEIPHASQMVSLVDVHCDTIPSPTPHVLHGMHADLAAFDISLSPHFWQASVPPALNSPNPQAAQTVSVPSEHGATKPSPTAQVLHGTQADLAALDTSFRPHSSQ